MLTDEGYRSRFWRGYPHLRQVFEAKDGSIPHGVDLLRLIDGDEPRISIDHGPLGHLADLIAIARLLTRQSSDIHNAMRGEASSAEAVADELRRLLDELEGGLQGLRHAVARACEREIEAARTKARDFQELGWRLRSERLAHHPGPGEEA
ncbi:MAG: hypothetical protein ABI868_07815 [Acidobacteriota bacterium]